MSKYSGETIFRLQVISLPVFPFLRFAVSIYLRCVLHLVIAILKSRIEYPRPPRLKAKPMAGR